MDQSVVTKLNQLNQQFYQTVAVEFTKTRQQAWEGWTKLEPFLTQLPAQHPQVLDVGCGNGRFGAFLHQEFPDTDWKYTGIDNSSELLAVAKNQLKSIYTKAALQLIEADILTKLDTILTTNADLICLFGVMHHIPSFALRQTLLQKLSEHLLPGGLLIFTAWQFDQIPNILARQKTASEIGLQATDLEANDYLLTWERGPTAIRYCHLLAETEAQQLIAATGLELVASFAADGQQQQTNQYYVLRKKEN